jgi:hypothetical protein
MLLTQDKQNRISEEEVLIAGELWNFLSGDQETMDDILDVIKKTVSQVTKPSQSLPRYTETSWRC